MAEHDGSMIAENETETKFLENTRKMLASFRVSPYASNEIAKSVADQNAQTMSRAEKWLVWLHKLGITMAHPNDGWVDRKEHVVRPCYPSRYRNPQVGDIAVLGDYFGGLNGRLWFVRLVERIPMSGWMMCGTSGLRYDNWRYDIAAVVQDDPLPAAMPTLDQPYVQFTCEQCRNWNRYQVISRYLQIGKDYRQCKVHRNQVRGNSPACSDYKRPLLGCPTPNRKVGE